MGNIQGMESPCMKLHKVANSIKVLLYIDKQWVFHGMVLWWS